MSENAVSEMMERILKSHFDVNAFDENWVESLQRTLNHPNFPNRAREFKSELASAILDHTISPAQYEKLTGEDFDTPEDLEEWLREVWQKLYDGKPVTA